MKDTLLSESPSESRDPFQKAQSQFNSKKNSTMLSQSPMNQKNPMEDQIPVPDMKEVLQSAGIEIGDLQMNPMGKFQLIQGLQGKFGENYAQNPDALKVISAFDENLKSLGSSKVQANMNKSLANAERTLGMLLRGQGE